MSPILCRAMKNSAKAKAGDRVELPIFMIRGQRVIMDTDLAVIYRVTTKALNQAIKRHEDRFPEDFAFQLTQKEVMSLRAQASKPSPQNAEHERDAKQWSQSVTTVLQGVDNESIRGVAVPFLSRKERHRRVGNLPWVFTEHGALMAANILRSPRAVQMSVYVVRAFIKQREQLMANAAIFRHLAEIDKTLLEHDDVLRTIWNQLQPLLDPPPEEPKPRMGFA